MAQPRLWEREAVTGALAHTLAQAMAGHGGALFVLGEAGLGKTSVLDVARARASGDMDVGFGRGEKMEATLPFGVAVQAFRSLRAKELVDVLRAAGSSVAEPATPFHRTMRWFERPGRRPVLLVFDDLHWADADSLALVAFLVRRLASLPVAVVGALRPWPPEAAEVVRGLVEQAGATVERLAAINPESASALLDDRVGRAVPDEVRHRSWELCRGNPLLVELVAKAVAGGENVPGIGEHPRAELGQHLLLARFAGLGPTGLQVARAAAVLGTSFRPSVAGEVAGLNDPLVDDALEGLSRSGLVTDVGDGVMRFVHPLFAQALYDDIAPPLRRRLHARSFQALRQRGLDAEASQHSIRAELVGDPDAIEVLTRAGRAALRAGAVATAGRDIAAAVRFSADHPSTDLLLLHAQLLIATGRVTEATAVCQQLLDAGDLSWSDRVDVLRMLGRAQYLTGEVHHGDAALSRAATIAEAHDPVRAVQPLLDRALSAWLGGGPGPALPIAARARALAAAGPHDLRHRADVAWRYLALESGDPSGLEATTPVTQRLVAGSGSPALDPVELAWPWTGAYNAAVIATYTERYDEAEDAFRSAYDAVDKAGAGNALATAAVYLANLLIRRGRLEEAVREAENARAFSELTVGVLAYADVVSAEALLWLGRLDESEERCAAAGRRAGGQWFADLWLAHVRGLRLLWQGDEAASEMFLTVEELARAAGIGEPCHIHWAGHAIAAHRVSGRPDDARRVVEWLEACGAALPCRWPRITAALGRAQLAWDGGDDDEADAAFARALDLHRQVDLPVQRVEALLTYGGFLRRRGRPADARPVLAEALHQAEQSGAGWLAATARSELVLAGGRRRRRSEGHGRLTSAERRVARLAAAGHSNAEIARLLFLSVNTVETHLKRVYAKLGLSSRRELMTYDRDGALDAAP